MWRDHAAVERTEGGVVVRLLDRGTRLMVSGARVADVRPLADGEIVELGAARLRFVDPAEVYLRRLEGAPAMAPAAMPPRGLARSEWVIFGVGAAAALAALSGLVVVLLW